MNETPTQGETPVPAETAAPAENPAVPDPEPPARIKLPFEFRGSGAEYFRIWIVNLLLTILTLGIYSAWAKVRRLRYFYGNTVLDGNTFDYHGKPLAILKGRLVVFVAYVAFLVTAQLYPVAVLVVFIPLAFLGVPWIIMRSRMFQLRMTSYRNLRFNFLGTYGGAMAAFVGWYFLTIITVFTLYPVWVRKRVEYSLDNAAYGDQAFSFLTKVGKYYKFCLITFALSMVGYIAFIFQFFKLPGVRELFYPGAPPPNMLDMVVGAGPVGWAMILIAVVAGLGIAGYYKASFANAAFGGVQAGSQYGRSFLRAWPLIGIYISNLLALIVTLGLFYPWAKVRQYRYHLRNTLIDSDGGLAAFTASSSSVIDAVGQEAGDFFNVDFGI
jgi:uncharacterized membrane protein YjgN (DUF898 family)